MRNTFLIHIVDDEADYRFLLQHIFKRFLTAHSVSFFSSGRAFLYHLSKSNRLPDLVLVDRQMPGLSGYDVVHSMKTHQFYKRIPVVMLSADASPAEIVLCYQMGANSFVTKVADVNSIKSQMTDLCHYWLAISSRIPPGQFK